VYITVSELSKYWNIAPTGVLHVGAHLGEEASDYEKFGWTPVIWVEAQPSLVKVLNSKLDPAKHKVIEAAVWEEDGVPLKLHIASNSQSTSLLNFGSHADSYPDITFVSEIDVSTKRLDSLIKPEEMPNFINLDIQGVELSAIKSLGKLLLLVDYIYTEVNKNEVYEGCTLVTDLDEFLVVKGFKRASTRWYLKEGWGDALYIRINAVNGLKLRHRIPTIYFEGKFYFRQFLSRIKHLFLIVLSK
jgi:FkbM family methyltransferase